MKTDNELRKECELHRATAQIGFKKELESLINRYSMESGSNTPDFLLSEYLCRCLRTFDFIVDEREKRKQIP